MPFKSEAQRKYFHAQANQDGKEGEKWKKMAGEWEKKTPKGKKLPKKVGESFETKLNRAISLIR